MRRLGGAPHGVQEGPAHLGIQVRGEEKHVHAVEQFVAEPRGVGFEEFCDVAFVLKEPRQDAVDQRVGAQDGYDGVG